MVRRRVRCRPFRGRRCLIACSTALGSFDELEAVVVTTSDDPEDAAIRRPRGTLEMCHASRRAAASTSGFTIGSEQTAPVQT